MKRALIVLSTMLLALSCNKMADVNIVRGFASEFPGIFVPEGKTLTISGNGKLDAGSNGFAPGIGSEGGIGKHGGNIIVQGGTIRATGGDGSSAIGTVTVGGKVGPVSESPFVYKP